jgi:Protein of unknown function (DUF2510)
MAMAIVAAVLWALGNTLGGLAYAVFSASNLSTSKDLFTASAWLEFAAGLLVLGATCYVAWNLSLDRQWSAMGEVLGTALSSLILTIGLLVAATEVDNGISTAANVTQAIGFGGWAVVIVVGAARRALIEQESPGAQHQAGLRLAAAASILVIAISIGLPSPSLTDEAPGIASGVIGAVGFAALVTVLSIARTQRMIVSNQFRMLAVGLWVIVLQGLAFAVSSGVVSGPPPPSLLTVRVALSIPEFIYTASALVLAWAALGRVGELSSGHLQGRQNWPHMSPVGLGEPPFEPPPVTPNEVPPSWQPDPARRHDLRWWDGTQWTDHVVDAGRLSLDSVE